MSPAITDIPLSELPRAVDALGFPRYAASQLVAWLYGKLARSFEEMTDLSSEARRLLSERYDVSAVRLEQKLSAPDGTIKALMSAGDGSCFECVLIPADDARLTACLSTQSGCAMGCAFCRTAELGLARNLTQGEILGQLIALSRSSGAKITNVVLMGMGEPLANMEAVLSAIEIMRAKDGFDLSKRRITLSTCGLLPELREFAARCDVKIAISLNATTDEVRDRIMPINRRYPIADIMAFAREYSRRSRWRITFEYVMLRGVNDSREDAARLVALLSGVRAKVNLIPFNPCEGLEFEAPSQGEIEWWREFLFAKGIQANIRVSRGQEIMAACGQLASKSV